MRNSPIVPKDFLKPTDKWKRVVNPIDWHGLRRHTILATVYKRMGTLENQAKILVVDDEPTICSMMTVFLTQIGYQVETVNSGEDAIALFDANPPDMVLLDISMPGMRGIDVLQCMKSRKADCGVIMLSGLRG